ncbi:hypothetical protein CCL17_11155 [Pseudomonas congelans]|nr:hypothetical protein CCL17_11155 [Pseudomonas congelans]
MLAARTCVEYPEHAVLDTLKPLVKREPVTQSVTKGIPTLEREERQVFGRNAVPMLRVGMPFWTLCVRP